MTIAVENLTKAFGDHRAVDSVSFDVPANSLFCVVGPSGCGKSTLLRLISGLEVPDTGKIWLDGQPVVDIGTFVPPEDRRTGVVFQSYALWPHMTVAENVAFPYQARGVATAEAMRRAERHLDTVALGPFAGRRPEALSGGQRQRVALARCLAGNARTILMDEPLANLDPHLRETMETELRAFHDSSGVTTLFITHDQREAMALADVMAVMEAGRLLQVAPPHEIYSRPANARVARFIGRGTLIETVVDGPRADVFGQTVDVAGAGRGRQTIFIRPEHIEVGPTGWPGTVTSVHYRGNQWEATVRGESGTPEIKVNLVQPARLGERLNLTFRRGWILPA